ncbi:MAG: zinc-ribbon domain-containing protein [Chloroflexi bacterium]|nr:MAG: zinc-ribbon domain-containing protein [Chloroflexota bacterium]
MRCPNCQTINPPTAKFCLECGRRFGVCPNCGTVNVPTAKYCIECGTALLPKETDEHTQQLLLQANGHTHPLPAIMSQPPEERRVVTVMFADITGSTPLADHLDPEDMRAILSGYFNLMTEQIRKHGGTVEKYIGDAVMAVFGVPFAHEDDPDRAIRAAIDMQAALARFNEQRLAQDPEATRLQMRIGINTGEVAATSNAQDNRGDFLITGDAVNVAARLQSVATPDTILVGERTYLSTRNVFDFRALAPLRLKGKTDPITAWVVIGQQNNTSTIAQHPRGLDGLEARLVGRTLELALMHATYARVQAEQRPHLITLLGVPGIGKSRLVREFLQSEEETSKCTTCEDRLVAPRILQGRCPPYGEGVTYRPLVEILNSLLNVRKDETYETLESRFEDFVRETLIAAKSAEDPVEVAYAIIRSVGRRTGDTMLAQNYPDQLERERLRGSSTLAKNTDQSSQSGPHMALMRAWRIFLEALAQQQPLIIIIDDLQWADEALLDLLEYLTDRITDVPILFLCPARPDLFDRRREWGGGRRNFTTIVLESLSREESSDLVNELLKTEEIPGVLRYTILNRAEGNPFFVEEIVRMLIDQKVLVKEDGSWRISTQNEGILSELASPSAPPDDTLIDLHYVFPLPRVPDTIQGVLAARVDLLSPIEKRVLQHACIIGRTFWLSALIELASDLPANIIFETLDQLVQRDFVEVAEKQARSPVENDQVFTIKHILIRDVVYNNIPRMRRSQEHAQLAIWLEEKAQGHVEAFVELLAYHYQQALSTWSAGIVPGMVANHDSQGPAASAARLTRSELRSRVITYTVMAGDQALHSYFTIRAIQAYSEALELLIDSNADSQSIAAMHEKLGGAYTQRGNLDEAWQEYRRALQLVTAEGQEDSDHLLHLYNHLSELGTRWLGYFNTNPSLQDTHTYIEAGLKLLEGKPISGQNAEFLTYQAFWYVRNQLESTDTQERARFADLALHSGNEALRIAEELNDTDAIWLTLDALAYVYTKQHRYQDAHKIQHYREKFADKVKSRVELNDLYYSLGWTHEAVSDYPTALKWFGYSWRVAQSMESPSMLLSCLIGRMLAWQRWNRWDEAQQAAKSILQMVEQYQLIEPWQLEALETLTLIAYATGQEEEGDSYLRQYKRILERYCTAADIAPIMPLVHLVREDWTRAVAEYREQLERSEPFPSPNMLALLAELVVITGESIEVQQASCAKAITATEQSGTRRSLTIALRARGRMHLEQHHWKQAEEDLKQSLQYAKDLDLPWDRGKGLYCLGLLYRRRADVRGKNRPNERKADLGRAQFHFEKALGFFESLNAVHDVERARLALAQDHWAPV